MGWLIVDIEASGLGTLGYPIEIAWTIVGQRGGTSALIRPRPEWQVPGSWDVHAQAVHGIDQDMLQTGGLDADRVASAFLRATTGRKVLSDMPCMDGPWLARLTGRHPELHDFWEQARLLGDRSREAAAVGDVDRVLPERHRAAADVRRLRFLWERVVGLSAAA